MINNDLIKYLVTILSKETSWSDICNSCQYPAPIVTEALKYLVDAKIINHVVKNDNIYYQIIDKP